MTGIRKGVKENSSLILTVGAGIGVITTAYLTGKASFQAANILDRNHQQYLGDDDRSEPDLKEKIHLVWKLYIPAGIAGATTIVCVAGVKHIDGRKLLAGQTALAVSQRAYEGYRAQVVEELGEKKDQLFAAKVAEKRMNESPPLAVIPGSGTIMCCELFTGRYFNSDMDTLNKAVNEINAKLNKHDYATLDDLYYLIGLQTTTMSGEAGWESGRLLELEYSSVLLAGKPCLAFSYNYVKSL